MFPLIFDQEVVIGYLTSGRLLAPQPFRLGFTVLFSGFLDFSHLD
jgi:hypothetical protein